MKQFAQLFETVDQTTKTNAKVKALESFFNEAEEADKVWAIALFTHKRPRRTVNTTLLRTWAAEEAGLPLWLFEESYHIVGDLAETVTLVLPGHQNRQDKTLDQVMREIISLGDKTEEEKKAYVKETWKSLQGSERFLFNKLITGGFRMGVSAKLLTKGLSLSTGIDEQVLAHRLMGNWDPAETEFHNLVLAENPSDNQSKPYPFYLAYALESDPEELGNIYDWIAEWKWDGIRGQIINRDRQLYIWSRGEDLITDRFPEFKSLIDHPTTDYVIDGELICYKDGRVMSFNKLQTRIGRKTIGKKLLQENPVIMIAYDLLEWKGEDLRALPMYERRALLESLIEDLKNTGVVKLSTLVQAESWIELREKRETSREIGAEGLMLKKADSTYKVGRKRGEWWKWKVDPMTVDAVMIYAQRGHGRRANLYTDFTFAVKDEEGNLVPFTKAYSGLTDKEFNEITRWVRKNTLERFGPVNRVNPELVFELAFEGIAESKRHKSGIALRFPRMKRWRKDKPVTEIDTLDYLRNLLPQEI